MGEIRNGARSFLDLMAKACRLSHTPGFRPAVLNILGPTVGENFFLYWDPVCAAVDLAIETDNWFNKLDYHSEVTGDEDLAPVE